MSPQSVRGRGFSTGVWQATGKDRFFVHCLLTGAGAPKCRCGELERGAWHSASLTCSAKTNPILSLNTKARKGAPLTEDGRVPRDTGNHFLHGVVKVCKGLVLLQMGVSLDPKVLSSSARFFQSSINVFMISFCCRATSTLFYVLKRSIRHAGC